MSDSPVVHFEMGYTDRDRMKKFYSSALGWNMQQLGDDMGGYVVAQTADTDTQGMVQTPGAINGGFFQKSGDPARDIPSVVVSVKDVSASMKSVEDAGGKILGIKQPDGTLSMEPTMIPGIGLWMACEDTEGNRFSLLQANERS